MKEVVNLLMQDIRAHAWAQRHTRPSMSRRAWIAQNQTLRLTSYRGAGHSQSIQELARLGDIVIHGQPQHKPVGTAVNFRAADLQVGGFTGMRVNPEVIWIDAASLPPLATASLEADMWKSLEHALVPGAYPCIVILGG